MKIPSPGLVAARLRRGPRVVTLLIIREFVESFVPIAALYTIMFERVGGLDFSQIGWLFAIWSLAYLVAELPSGVVADYWSRRNVIILGGIIRTIGFIVWLVWPGFAGYAIGFALWGAAIACTSGAVAAYLHDELRALGLQKHYARYYGWVMSAGSAGMLAGFILAAILTLELASTLIILSVLSSAVWVVVMLIAREHPYARQDSYFKTLQAGVREVRHNRRLRYVCAVLFSIYMTLGVLEELLPRVYAGFGLSDRLVAIFVAVSFLASTFLLTRLELFARHSLSRQVLAMCAGMAVLTIAVIWNGMAASLLVLLFSLIFYVFRPLFIHHTQTVSASDQRATIGSIPGLAAGLLGAGAYLLIGQVAARFSESVSIALYSLVWLGLFLYLAFAGRHYPRIPADSVKDATPESAPHV